MVERFVEFAGLISIGTGASIVTGSGTAFGGVDREGCQVWVQPAGAACFRIGTVAAVDPRGVYDDLSLPLLHPWNGAPVVDQPYELVDHPALANGVSQAAVYARFAAFLERNMGLIGNAADDVDYSLAANNSLFVDAVTRTIYQWRGGVLEPVFSVGLQFNPKGGWSNATTYAKNDMVVDAGRAFASNADNNLNHQPPSSSDGDAWWTRLPIAPMAPIEVGAIDTTLNAAAAVSGHWAVVLLSDGRVRHADPADIADAHRVIGVSLNAAVANDPVKVRRFGDVADASLSFAAGAPVFVGASGVLTQAPPTAPGSAFLLRIGAATAANALQVNPSPPLAF
jgi:hypothetical protein